MIHKARKVRDPFAFSLGGMATIASVVAPPVIADDEINKILDARAARDSSQGPHLPLFSQTDYAQVCCA